MNKFSQDILITKEAIDINSHVNNVMYVKWMQDIAVAHSQAVGDTFEAQKEKGYMWVVRTHSIDYLHQAYENETIHLHTWTERYKKTVSKRKYEFTNKNGDILARAETIFACLNAETFRPIRIPEELHALYE